MITSRGARVCEGGSMATKDAVIDALLDQIAAEIEKNDSLRVLRFAEAYAWLSSPGQPHGSSPSQSVGEGATQPEEGVDYEVTFETTIGPIRGERVGDFTWQAIVPTHRMPEGEAVVK